MCCRCETHAAPFHRPSGGSGEPHLWSSITSRWAKLWSNRRSEGKGLAFQEAASAPKRDASQWWEETWASERWLCRGKAQPVAMFSILGMGIGTRGNKHLRWNIEVEGSSRWILDRRTISFKPLDTQKIRDHKQMIVLYQQNMWNRRKIRFQLRALVQLPLFKIYKTPWK